MHGGAALLLGGSLMRTGWFVLPVQGSLLGCPGSLFGHLGTCQHLPAPSQAAERFN